MSTIWPHATPADPCPICHKPDWCQFGERAMKCMRAESSHPCPSGGWYHFYDTTVRPEFFPQAKASPHMIDAEAIMNRLSENTTAAQFESCSKALGVTADSLHLIGAAFYEAKNAWAFPMCDGNGNLIGIRLRNSAGFKWAVTGSRQGIFIPSMILPQQKVVFLPEGPTDVCALLSIGLFAIGRPTCNTGLEHLLVALKRMKFYRAVIVADNDDMKTLGNREGRPGIEGAVKLQNDLKICSCIWIPPSPIKDARDFMRRGGKRIQIESEIRNKIWKQ
jgi:hypothetical protein